jgi:DNA-binding transcriptional ArsR family regulator
MDDAAAANLARALSHPLRIALLRALRDSTDLSPTEYARENDEPLGNVSYHMRVLLDTQVIAVAGTVPRRGAVEHRYALKGRHTKMALAMLDLLGGD